ncbi:hypothetical protein B484DRAFT_395220, partial [Ochromonadaceae sp. CCMP2298]
AILASATEEEEEEEGKEEEEGEEQEGEEEGGQEGAVTPMQGSQVSQEVRLLRAVRGVVRLAERLCDRVDSAALLELLPPQTPVALLLGYCRVVVEYGSVKRRNLQIVHQLLRVREVQIRTHN